MRRRLRRRLLIGSLLALLPVVAVGSAVLVHKSRYFQRRFAVVKEGVLYRSSQPRGRDWRVLGQYGIRTVVNLRPPEEDREDFQASQEACAAAGVTLIDIPVAGPAPSEDQLLQFLRIVQDQRMGPVLVHCEHGRTRAGVFVAVYRVVIEGWSPEAALGELARFRKKPATQAHADLIRRSARERSEWLRKVSAAAPSSPRLSRRSGEACLVPSASVPIRVFPLDARSPAGRG